VRILLTNDDGIHAPGIVALYDALTRPGPLADPPGTATRAPRDAVFTVAPLTVQSATSHGVTFHAPIMTQRSRVNERMEGIAVDARPADCVKLAISTLWPTHFGAGSRPDLVISGLNAGANCGINVIYSGTVAAALEAAFLGVPSIAVSLHIGRGRPLFDAAAAHARRAIEAVIAKGLPRPHECLSINIPITEEPPAPGDEAYPEGDELPAPPTPARDPRQMPPISVCPMNTHGLVDQFEERRSPSGKTYYWASGHGLDFRATEQGSDVDLLLKRHITVTPLWYDLTNHNALDAWRARVGPR
jgi:5'-nucleotidase